MYSRIQKLPFQPWVSGPKKERPILDLGLDYHQLRVLVPPPGGHHTDAEDSIEGVRFLRAQATTGGEHHADRDLIAPNPFWFCFRLVEAFRVTRHLGPESGTGTHYRTGVGS